MKKVLSVILAMAMLLSFGAVFAFAGVNCDCDDCEDELCECIGELCDDEGCECICHAEEEAVDEWEAPCGCADCEEDTCECTADECTCECCAEAAPPVNPPVDPPAKKGYELWKIKLTTGKLGKAMQTLANWGDWILKILYYVCFGWLYNFVVDITITEK